MALGTLEVHPLDLNHAYGTLANGGRYVGHADDPGGHDADGEDVLPPYEVPAGDAAVSDAGRRTSSPTSWPATPTPSVNPIWAEHAITDRRGRRRPAAFKTGTTNDAKDLNAYGYIAPPSQQGRRRRRVRAERGRLGRQQRRQRGHDRGEPGLLARRRGADLGRLPLEVTRSWQVNDFRRPDGPRDRARGRVHGLTRRRSGRVDQVSELFMRGTAPGEDPYLRGVEVVRGTDDAGIAGRTAARAELARAATSTSLTPKPTNPAGTRRSGLDPARPARHGRRGQRGPRQATFTAYFYAPYFQPYGQTWGGPFTPIALVWRRAVGQSQRGAIRERRTLARAHVPLDPPSRRSHRAAGAHRPAGAHRAARADRRAHAGARPHRRSRLRSPSRPRSPPKSPSRPRRPSDSRRVRR